jgi:hypothetical protein
MTHKTHDLAVKTGTYMDRQGNEKGRWQNVGSVLETNDGGRVILLNRTFNPAGVPNPEGRDTVMISMFEPKERDQQPAADIPKPAGNGKRDTSWGSGGSVARDDDVPFAQYMRGTVA